MRKERRRIDDSHAIDMKYLLCIAFTLAGIVPASYAFKISGKGENHTSVQSFEGGRYYLRSTPDDDFGTAGKTELYAVKKGGDELQETFPVYMRGELFLGWISMGGKWAVVQVEPVRITSNDDFKKLGKVSRVVFYLAGKKIKEYPAAELAELGMKRISQSPRQVGDFSALGNDYTQSGRFPFKFTFINEKYEKDWITFDLETGELLKPE